MFDTVMRSLLLVATVSIVAALSAWTARTAFDQLFGPARRLVMPFHVIGKPDADTRLGTALAQMLIGRLARIQDETESTIAAFRGVGSHEASTAGAAAQTTQVTQRPSFTLPTALFEPIDLKLSLAGVEVGVVLSWFQRWFNTDDAMRVTVEFVDGESRTIVAGGGARGMKAVHLEVPSQKHQDVIDRLAYQLIQQQLTAAVPEMRALELAEFQIVLTELAKVAEAKDRGRIRTNSERDTSEASYRVLAPIADKVPGWCNLRVIVAQLAVVGGHEEEALLHFDNAIRCFEAKKADAGVVTAARPTLQAEADSLRKQLQARRQLAEAAPARPPPPGGQPPERLADPTTGRLLQAKTTGTVLGLLGVNDLAMPREVRVGIVGGLPTKGLLAAGSYTILGGLGEQDRGDAELRAYVDSLAQWVRVVAPRAHLVFAPFDGGTAVNDSTLLRALDTMLREPPEVLLWTFGPLRGTVWTSVFQRAAERGVLVVHAAGNRPDEKFAFEGTPLMKTLLVAASVDLNGRPSPFTSRPAEGCWAPGQDLPVVLSQEAPLVLRSGTSYAAAVCAGVAVRVLAVRSGPPAQTAAAVEKLVALLKASGTPAPGQTVPLVNLSKALRGS